MNQDSDSDPNAAWDTDEIASLDSDSLHATRPNRWRGTAQKWEALTDAERTAAAALEAARNRDLAVHLYDAFALRRDGVLGSREAGRVPNPGEDINAATGEVIQHTDWVVPPEWTAWPLRAEQLPPDDGYPEAEFRGVSRQQHTTTAITTNSSTAGLEDEVAATILRFAAERFRGRNLQSVRETVEARDDDDGRKGDEGEGEGNLGVKEEEELLDSATLPRKKRRKRAPSPTYLPALAADDDLSYELLRPEARRILARLDDTLVVLHNVRIAGMAEVASESESQSESASEAAYAARTMDSATETSRTGTPTLKRRREHLPKVRKKRVFSEGDEGSDEEQKEDEGEEEEEEEEGVSEQNEGNNDNTRAERDQSSAEPPKLKKRRRHSSKRRATSRSSGPGSSDQDRGKRSKKPRLRGLRSWQDVLGAAALAGFSPAVIARATQRCATQFRQGMEMHTLVEVPASGTGGAGAGAGAGSHRTGRTTRRYVPGEPLPESAEEDEGGGNNAIDAQRLRSLSRSRSRSIVSQRSMLSSGRPGFDDDDDGSGEEKQTAGRRSRSRTPGHRRSATPGPIPCHYCPHTGCPRAIEGFTRHSNLVRHMKLVHRENMSRGASGRPASVPLSRSVSVTGSATPDEDTEDADVDGAVHVDGFLQPIMIQKGWRAGGMSEPKSYDRDTNSNRSRGRSRTRKGLYGRSSESSEEGGRE